MCYRSTSSSPENDKELLKLLDKTAGRTKIDHILVMGDFNYPEISYTDFNVDSNEDSSAYSFFIKTQDMYLYQNVHDTTRQRIGNKPSILDYIFTDEDNLIEELEYELPLGKSDHVCLSLKYIAVSPHD